MHVLLSVVIVAVSLWLPPSDFARSASADSPQPWRRRSVGSQIESRKTWWPDGTLKSVAQYQNDVLHGQYRTWYASGQPYELRHFDRGRESGRQQSWTAAGELYLNYEVRNGRRYGYINAKPCVPVEETHR